MTNHPHLKSLHTLFTEEVQPFRKVHRMIDLFESIIKSHTVVILAEYVKCNDLSDTAKGMLSQGLRTPSLGTWQLFSRVLFEELEVKEYQWTINSFVDEFKHLDKALNNDKTNVIAFRNGYAHGATPSDLQCEKDIERFEPFLNMLLSSMWLEQSSTHVKDGLVYLKSETDSLCLHPILLHREENSDASFAFFNDLKNDKIGLLNYPLGKHYREKEFFKEFHNYLPLNEWKKSGNNEFYQRIEELTETFKGRTAERESLLQFVLNKSKGYFSVQGNPGIGKSALIAQFFKDLRGSKEACNVQVVEYFIRRGTAQAQTEYLLNYLIKRTDEVFPQGKEVRAEGKMVFDLQQQLFSKWRLWSEHSNGKKLLFLIDGLDEGVENNVVSYLPRENFEDVLIIYGSRPGGHKTIDELWATLPIENHTKIELSGLSKEDIRALIYEVANKYDLERESEWIEVVQQRSQGNPLYLKLLCDSIENKAISLNDVNALPTKIDEYYKAILLRYAQDPDGDALLAGLYTFAAAKDYLTLSHLGLINQIGDAVLERIGSTLKEVLYENPLTEDVLDYQLFHESFREYLVKEKALKVNEASYRIIDFCSSWKDLQGQWEQRYALEHYAAHLHESKKEIHIEQLLKLIYDSEFQTTQKKVLRGFEASNALFRLALLKTSEVKRFDEQLEAGLCLVDLKYEEANDAPQIVAMVAAGEIDLALKRIESFGGADQEGMQRKFILYMLCLMELTLLDSKDKPFRKEGIERLLNHFDEQIPPDTSLINWNDFFPSYLMFQMACEWTIMGLDYLVVFKRTGNWRRKWLIVKGPYSSFQFEVLLACAWGISNKFWKSSALKDISTELAKQGQMQEAFACAHGIIEDNAKSFALKAISTELAKQGQKEEAASAIQEALACARRISSEKSKSRALADISTELAKQDQVEEAASAMQEALACARGISDESFKIEALAAISTELANQGQVEEAASAMQKALDCARGVDWLDKNYALRDISYELAKQGRVEEALAHARGIDNESVKCFALVVISSNLVQQSQVEKAASAMREAIACARGIIDSDAFGKISGLVAISSELAQQGQMEEAVSAIREARACSLGISHASYKNYALEAISSELVKQGQVEEAASTIQEALACARGISDDYWKIIKALKDISTELVKNYQVEKALACARGISDESSKSLALADISAELAKQGQMEKAASAMQEALACAREESYDRSRSFALAAISSELAQQRQLEEASSAMREALACARGISYESDKGYALAVISSELVKQGQVQEALTCARGISDVYWKIYALNDISTELAKQGQMQEAFACAHGIIEDNAKSFALKAISTELAKQGQKEEAASAIQEALACARRISSEKSKSRALADISTELAKQGEMEEALACARGISDESKKISALKDISAELAKQGQVEEAASTMQEALACARGISDESKKISALKDISSELAKQGKVEEAETIGLEIPQIAVRHKCWKELAESAIKIDSWKLALNGVQNYKSDEARLFYLKGWCEYVAAENVTAECLETALPLIVGDNESIEALLQKYALQETLLGRFNPNLQQSLNRTLNIQWALDIVAQFPKEESSSRLSTNLETWLHEIADEDDREQIELWAKQVTKGKISEEEFGERVSGLL